MTGTPGVLLWDFGDTLADERWMRRPPPECPAWESVWVEVMADRADAWNTGRVGADEIVAALADGAAMTADAVWAHVRRCCESLAFHDVAWRLASERRLPQAIVTVNPDIFTELVVPAYGLDEVFDVIVTSWAAQTDDKPTLCTIALERLGFAGARSEALLIDNRLDLVEAWRAVGGVGYWFRGDDQLEADLASLGLAPATS